MSWREDAIRRSAIYVAGIQAGRIDEARDGYAHDYPQRVAVPHEIRPADMPTWREGWAAGAAYEHRERLHQDYPSRF